MFLIEIMMFTYIYIYIYMYLCTCIYIYTYVCVCMNVFMCNLDLLFLGVYAGAYPYNQVPRNGGSERGQEEGYHEWYGHEEIL